MAVLLQKCPSLRHFCCCHCGKRGPRFYVLCNSFMLFYKAIFEEGHCRNFPLFQLARNRTEVNSVIDAIIVKLGLNIFCTVTTLIFLIIAHPLCTCHAVLLIAQGQSSRSISPPDHLLQNTTLLTISDGFIWQVQPNSVSARIKGENFPPIYAGWDGVGGGVNALM